MNHVNIRRIPEQSVPLENTAHRGATVFGCPLCRELYSYMSAAFPDTRRQKLISMFFAGSTTPFSMEIPLDLCEEEDN